MGDGARFGNLMQVGFRNKFPICRVADASAVPDSVQMGNDVYAYRAEWVAWLARHFGGHEKFAVIVGKNAKHLSAVKGRGKNMGATVARAIEDALLALPDRLPEWRAGMLDSPPPMNASPSPAKPKSLPPSQSQSERTSSLTLALQLAAEALDQQGLTLPPPKYNELVVLIADLLEGELPEAQVLTFARRAAGLARGRDGEEDSENKGAAR